jgi:hypothetical protein
MPELSSVAIKALLTRLSDPASGFNANLQAVASTYGIEPWEVDWDPDASANFMIGQILPDQVEESVAFTYPFTTVDTGVVASDNRVVSAVFAGGIAMIVDIHISTRNESLPRSLTPLSQAIEDAFFETVNNLDEIGVYLSQQLTYNGKWTLQKSTAQMSGQNWRRTLRFTATFGRITD